jgi:hypothetical protein
MALMKDVIQDELDSLAEKMADIDSHILDLETTGGSCVRGNPYTPTETARYLEGAKRQKTTYLAMRIAIMALLR